MLRVPRSLLPVLALSLASSLAQAQPDMGQVLQFTDESLAHCQLVADLPPGTLPAELRWDSVQAKVSALSALPPGVSWTELTACVESEFQKIDIRGPDGVWAGHFLPDWEALKRNMGSETYTPPIPDRLPPGPFRDALLRVLRRDLENIEGCAMGVLERLPTLEGDLQVRVLIQPDGRVSHAVIAASNLLSQEPLESCIANRVLDLVFPTPDEPMLVDVALPVVLRIDTWPLRAKGFPFGSDNARLCSLKVHNLVAKNGEETETWVRAAERSADCALTQQDNALALVYGEKALDAARGASPHEVLMAHLVQARIQLATDSHGLFKRKVRTLARLCKQVAPSHAALGSEGYGLIAGFFEEAGKKQPARRYRQLAEQLGSGE